MFYLIQWRFILQKCTLRPISKISIKEQYDLIVNLKVHYKWFYKFAVRKMELITNINCHKIKEVLLRINKELTSLCATKVGKSYRKHSNVPPPLVNKHQLDVITKYNRISRRYDV
ncbi:unnamed protein product [Acanthoscelides obtectus]|uniref:Uncharacterized protein n=1 Tax=Acanthoscelides obtectus TaxID=200917 RepID=A0A9P0M278_ACAOB|nr:unnamed protein product [Acanthoscelides obtectus]CAK1678099.1 hypothetical protein AOBTE_LOCUS31753 [Acanthoscelides obtectus]